MRSPSGRRHVSSPAQDNRRDGQEKIDGVQAAVEDHDHKCCRLRRIGQHDEQDATTTSAQVF